MTQRVCHSVIRTKVECRKRERKTTRMSIKGVVGLEERGMRDGSSTIRSSTNSQRKSNSGRESGRVIRESSEYV